MALQRVETDAIEDDAVTTAKIAANAVAAADIAADAITNVKVAAGAAIAVSKITGLGTAATLTAGTAANNVVQLDGSARLPAISGANLTGISTDTSAMENNIAILAFKTQSSNNLAKFNLIDQVIDEYKDGTGATYTTAGQTGSTATAGYLSSIYTSTTTTTPSTSSDWSGNTGNATFTSGGVAWNVSDDAVRSSAALSGDFTLNFTGATVSSGGVPAVYPTSEDATFDQDHEFGDMHLMTNSYWLQMHQGRGPAAYAAEGIWHGSTTPVALAITTLNTNGIVGKFVRTGTELAIYIDNVLKHTFTGVTTTDMRACFAGTGSTTRSVYTGISWDIPTTAVNATGTATSTANTALTAPTTGDICMLVEEVDAVTATLNTAGNDLRCAISRNGGTGWDYVTLVNKGSWGTNKKILVANNVAFSNSASGTDMRYKLEWANQAAATAAGTTIAQATGSVIGDFTSNAANAFNDTSESRAAGATRSANVNCYIGKDLGVGNEKKITGASWECPTLNDSVASASSITFYLYVSNSAPTSYNNGTLLGTIGTESNGVSGNYVTSKLDFVNTTSYRYVWIHGQINGGAVTIHCSEARFYAPDAVPAVSGRQVNVHATSLAWA